MRKISKKFANMVALGAYLAVADCTKLDTIFDVLKKKLTGGKEKFIEPNIIAIKKGIEVAKSQM